MSSTRSDKPLQVEYILAACYSLRRVVFGWVVVRLKIVVGMEHEEHEKPDSEMERSSGLQQEEMRRMRADKPHSLALLHRLHSR
jgi:hypothetical protein